MPKKDVAQIEKIDGGYLIRWRDGEAVKQASRATLADALKLVAEKVPSVSIVHVRAE